MFTSGISDVLSEISGMLWRCSGKSENMLTVRVGLFENSVISRLDLQVDF